MFVRTARLPVSLVLVDVELGLLGFSLQSNKMYVFQFDVLPINILSVAECASVETVGSKFGFVFLCFLFLHPFEFHLMGAIVGVVEVLFMLEIGSDYGRSRISQGVSQPGFDSAIFLSVSLGVLLFGLILFVLIGRLPQNVAASFRCRFVLILVLGTR